MGQQESGHPVIKNEREVSAIRRADDLLIRVFAVVIFTVYAGYCFEISFVRLHSVDFSNLQLLQVGRVLAIFTVGLYTTIIAFLYIVRLRPVNKSSGVIPSITALVGGFMMMSLLLFNSREDLPVGVQVFADVLVVIGNIFAAIVFLQLGRSFSILPEGRRLVTHGVYSVVRHPLYLAETVSVTGLAITYWSPWVVVLAVVWFATQLARTYNEEKVLKEYFPEYLDYARKTPRVIPGIY